MSRNDIAAAANRPVNSSENNYNQSASTLDSLAYPIRVLSEIGLGQRIVPGIQIKFTSGEPMIHMAELSLKETMRDAQTCGRRLVELVDKYNYVIAETRSKAALRVLGLLLSHSADRNGHAGVDLLAEIKKAKKIDLLNPEDPQWKREIALSLEGVALRMRLSIYKVNPVERLISSMQVPEEDRKNRYGYRVELQPQTNQENRYSIIVRHIARQAVAYGAMFSPMIASQLVLSNSVVPALSDWLAINTELQRGLMASAHCAVLAMVGLATFFTLRTYDKRISQAPKNRNALERCPE